MRNGGYKFEGTILDRFLASAESGPDEVSLRYFGRDLTRAEVRDTAEQIAVALSARGVASGERVVLGLQNTPLFVASLLAIWRLGAIAIPVNPMVRINEFGHVVVDSGARIVLVAAELATVVDELVNVHGVELDVLWSDPHDLAGGMPLPFAMAPDRERSMDAWVEVEDPGPPPSSDMPGANDLALICYTSGTTGTPKGAMLSHGNLAYQATAGIDFYGMGPGDSILTIAPLFHITGMGHHLALALGNGLPMVLTYRFEPETVLQLIDRYSPTYTIGAITAFISIMVMAAGDDKRVSKLKVVYSGGAAVPESVVRQFEERFGVYIHNAYGMTETCSVTIEVPFGEHAPVDPKSGSLSIGKAYPWTLVSVVDEDGRAVPAGTVGELVTAGPQVGVGYWGKPEETANTFRRDGVHTGDVAFIDENGWIYIVDRLKDLVVVSGYKVWPREVEDVLYKHPAVREAAVVGIPDPYRGETIAAYLALEPGAVVSDEELKVHCRKVMAAYKCPTQFTIVSELPKTASGKVLRRLLGT